MEYRPTQKILENYANILVNFALNSGKGIKKDEVVRISAHESAKPLYVELRKAVLQAGGHIIGNYLPDDDDTFQPSRDFFEIAKDYQLKFFPEKYLRGLADTIDHNVVIISERSKRVLAGIDPKKLMLPGIASKPFKDWLDEKEGKGKYTWTLGLYGTAEMAKEAGLSEKEYWNQIIKACFLDEKNPIKKWKWVFKTLEITRKKLNALPIDLLNIEGKDADLWIKVGEKRKWMGGSGRNIPSFELFISPDWRGTEGWIRFNQPLYRYGNLITGIELEFKNGKVVKSSAKQNEHVLKQMIATKNADKVGEFSLTDRRLSRITKFMAETLFDENVGGKEGNTHIALGNAYQDGYDGDAAKLKKKDWERLGFNKSSVHTDIVSTTRRKVTAYLKNGKTKVIYENGEFKL